MKMTVANLAARAHITPNYLSDIETGRRRRNPSLLTVLALADALETDVAELLGGRGMNKLSPAGIEAGRLVEMLPSHIQTAVLQLLQVFARKRC